MSGDFMSTDAPVTPWNLSLAEQYASFVDYAASTTASPQPASTSLDVARFHAFTGELSFSTDPAVRLYLDGGVVYHAQRDGDVSISQLLRDSGVVEADQLERGMVRVGDVEHLGRLFDRESSIDRDALMVVVETATEQIVSELANRAVAGISVSAYRHHPSGIHRWFVAPAESSGSQRPVSAVAQVDRSVVDELPRLDAGALEIRWTESSIAGAAQPSGTAQDAEIQAELDRFDADQADWAAQRDNEPTPITPLSEFHIVWPDGTSDEALVTGSAAPLAPPDANAPAAPAADLPAPVASPTTPLTTPSTVAPTFSIAPLRIDALPEPDAAVPDDVAAAVKRALQAIEGASTGRASVPELSLTPIALPDPDSIRTRPPEQSPAPQPSVAPQPAAPTAGPVAAPPVAAPPAPVPLGFAPPTPEMRAEVMYEQAAAAARPTAHTAPAPTAPAPTIQDTPDTPATLAPPSSTERRGALSRLIGSLRHQDD